jgi:hypothetical protein
MVFVSNIPEKDEQLIQQSIAAHHRFVFNKKATEKAMKKRFNQLRYEMVALVIFISLLFIARKTFPRKSAGMKLASFLSIDPSFELYLRDVFLSDFFYILSIQFLST